MLLNGCFPTHQCIERVPQFFFSTKKWFPSLKRWFPSVIYMKMSKKNPASICHVLEQSMVNHHSTNHSNDVPASSLRLSKVSREKREPYHKAIALLCSLFPNETIGEVVSALTQQHQDIQDIVRGCLIFVYFILKLIFFFSGRLVCEVKRKVGCSGEAEFMCCRKWMCTPCRIAHKSSCSPITLFAQAVAMKKFTKVSLVLLQHLNFFYL